jgi:hypothetical protein
MSFDALMANFKQAAAKPISKAKATTNNEKEEDASRKRPLLGGNGNSNNNKAAKTSSGTTTDNGNDKDKTVSYPTIQDLPSPIQRIFLACPAHVETGGPEAMHQLCDMIIRCTTTTATTTSSGTPFSMDNTSSSGTTTEAAAPVAIPGNMGTTSTTTMLPKVEAYMLYLNEVEEAEDEDDAGDGTDMTGNSKSGHTTMTVVHAPLASVPLPYRVYHTPVLTGQVMMQSTGLSQLEHFLTSSDLIIWPEVWTKYRNVFSNTHAQQCIWWLSVNNNKGQFGRRDFMTRTDIRHLYQSEYARRHLMKHLPSTKTMPTMTMTASAIPDDAGDAITQRRKQVQVMPMTEYIPSRRIPLKEQVFAKSKRDLDVVYNPIKGWHYTQDIMDHCAKRSGSGGGASNSTSGTTNNAMIQFTPIGGDNVSNGRRLTPEEVTALLLRAKIYIDFGPHPGMDRLPREAALCGCVVVMHREGAAQYQEDVPLKDKYKVAACSSASASTLDVDQIYDILQSSIQNYDDVSHNDFDDYRAWIHGQYDRMQQCVRNFLNDITSSTSTTIMTGDGNGNANGASCTNGTTADLLATTTADVGTPDASSGANDNLNVNAVPLATKAPSSTTVAAPVTGWAIDPTGTDTPTPTGTTYLKAEPETETPVLSQTTGTSAGDEPFTTDETPDIE